MIYLSLTLPPLIPPTLIWQRGLLRKGPSLCHGAAGNGFVFLVLYRLTNDEKYLARSRHFADWLAGDEGRSVRLLPDCPFSLFEGLAGVACYFSELKDPASACFPLFEI